MMNYFSASWFVYLIFNIACAFICKQQSTGGNPLDKLVSGYEAVYSSQLDEDAIFSKCRNAISFVEKVDKDVEGDFQLGMDIFILMDPHCYRI